MEKQTEFAGKIIVALEQVLKDEESECYIGLDAIEKNANEFFHALSTMAPNYVYCKLTGENLSSLDFNHLANELCFQFSEIEKQPKNKIQ